MHDNYKIMIMNIILYMNQYMQLQVPGYIIDVQLAELAWDMR